MHTDLVKFISRFSETLHFEEYSDYVRRFLNLDDENCIIGFLNSNESHQERPWFHKRNYLLIDEIVLRMSIYVLENGKIPFSTVQSLVDAELEITDDRRVIRIHSVSGRWR